MNDDQVRWTALFFLYSFMDEKTALEAAQKAISNFKAALSTKVTQESARRVLLIKIFRKTFETFRKQLPRNRQETSMGDAWVLPPQVDLQPWKKFQQNSSDGEIVAVVLSRILKFTDHEISEGLNISIGTARYRIGKGVRQLGACLRLKG